MHRPEKWGYVQFTHGKPGTVKFNPDASAPARMVLQEIYYSQKDFQKANKRWAISLAELKLTPHLGRNLALPPALRTTAEGFQATVGVKGTNGSTQNWHIRQDAKVWTE